MEANELTWMDAVGQAELVRSGAIPSRHLVDEAIERIDRLDPVIGALVARRFDQARTEADSLALEPRPDDDRPFAGVPFLLKDAVQHSQGDRYQHGMRFLRDNPWTSPRDTELTRRYRAAGLVVLGRTKVAELTISSTTEPLAFGPTANPWDLSRSPGLQRWVGRRGGLRDGPGRPWKRHGRVHQDPGIVLRARRAQAQSGPDQPGSRPRGLLGTADP
jgi:amidase